MQIIYISNTLIHILVNPAYPIPFNPLNFIVSTVPSDLIFFSTLPKLGANVRANPRVIVPTFETKLNKKKRENKTASLENTNQHNCLLSLLLQKLIVNHEL